MGVSIKSPPYIAMRTVASEDEERDSQQRSKAPPVEHWTWIGCRRWGGCGCPDPVLSSGGQGGRDVIVEQREVKKDSRCVRRNTPVAHIVTLSSH